MIRAILRRMIRAELEEMRADLARHLAQLIVQNNERIEADLIDLGVLERDGNESYSDTPASRSCFSMRKLFAKIAAATASAIFFTA